MSAPNIVPTQASRETLEFERKEADYRFPLPIKGDHWKNCFDAVLKEDRDRYEVWKDEIQNLLIFAGLFSAVVTAFAINAYKSLQPDPNQTVTLLLSQIASRLDNSSSAVTSTIIPPFVPSSAAVRINIYWFLSLLLSLATVLVGIITMQWLREYQRYKNNVTSKQAFAQRNMRFESLKAWHVQHILTGLPLLLQAALLLFILGIIEFLLDLAHVVAIPCIVVAAFTLLFHGYTTISPAFQYYWYQLDSNSRGGDPGPIPPPCPYKSPQAWAFHSCTQVWGVSHVWRALLNTLHNLYRFIRFIFSLSHGRPKTLGSITWSFLSESTIEWVGSHRSPLSSWNNIDLTWLRRRHTHDSANNYDAARGLARIVQLHSQTEMIAFSSYHCFSEISSKDSVRQEILDYMSPILLEGESRPMSWTKPDKADSLSREEVLIGFLNFLPQSSPKNPRHVLVWKHQTELLIQAYTTHHILSVPSQVIDTQSRKHGAQAPCPFLRGVFLLPRFVEEMQYLGENVGQWDDALKTQLKQLHQDLGQTQNLDIGPNSNSPLILAFLERFAPQSRVTVPPSGIPRQTHHGILEIERTKTRSSQDLHAHFQTSPEHIEILIPPAIVKGAAETDQSKPEAGTSHTRVTNASQQKVGERHSSPYLQPLPDNAHSKSMSLSTSTLSDVSADWGG